MMLKIPNYTTSCHIAIYLPTSGLEAEFVSAMASLDACLEEIYLKYDPCPIFIRGDANVNEKHASRAPLFKHFLDKHDLLQLDLVHPTYHHFLGDGLFDSSLDVLLYKKLPQVSEHLKTIVCKLSNPLINSHHDAIVSTFSVPPSHSAAVEEDLVVAPKVPNMRAKIVWDSDGICCYQSLIGDNLKRLRETWCNPDSPASMSVLLSSTYSILSEAAAATNHHVDLGAKVKPKPRHHPHISSARRHLLVSHKKFTQLTALACPDPSILIQARETLTQARAMYRHTIRQTQILDDIARDQKMNTLLQKNPSTSLFRSIKRFKSENNSNISNLKVNRKKYSGEQIPDGFYDSLSSLKAPDMSPIHSSPEYKNTLLDYENIVKICKQAKKIPPINPKQSTDILLSLRAEVNDFYSITASHFINAGKAGYEHFHFLLSSLAKNVNLASLEELNTVWACILFKGHGKDKKSDRSYRTISTCPLLAKALDTYIGKIYGSGWQEVQAQTQFQGPGSCHDLAALLLTEAVQYSLHTARLPVYV